MPDDSTTHGLGLMRRSFLLKMGLGLGGFALAELVGGHMWAQDGASAPSLPPAGGLPAGHLPARAKRVISLHMSGAISHVDTFDYKPSLAKMHGQELPPSVRGDARLSTMVAGQSSFPIVKPLAAFQQGGESGIWISDLLPYTREIVDDLCFIKTMHTAHVNHEPASKFLHTGFERAGRPSAGAWVSYALGSDNRNLPTFVVLSSGRARSGSPVEASLWGPGFLPSHYQGVRLLSGSELVPYLDAPEGITLADRRRMLDLLNTLTTSQHAAANDPEILSRVHQYEMAYRMQQSMPDVADLSDEPAHVLDMYGPDVQQPGSFARNCLLARRLAERDVKFIQLFETGWDDHTNIARALPPHCRLIDQPVAALVRDLKQRGMLEDTLVVFGSEFGRTVFAQGSIHQPDIGRDHHANNFVWWLAGGGVKQGHTHGETDDFSYNVVKDPVSIHDFQATMLHILGLDHERLTFKYQGRDFRLTDVHGRVVSEILA